MKNSNTDCLVYPGEHVPLLKEEEMNAALKKSYKANRLSVPVNVSELEDCYKVEVAVPGIKKENFVVFSDKNILTVCALNKGTALHKGELFQLREFNYDCLERHIMLPANADLSFIIAEYRSGMLEVHIPKSDHPVLASHTRIVVY